MKQPPFALMTALPTLGIPLTFKSLQCLLSTLRHCTLEYTLLQLRHWQKKSDLLNKSNVLLHLDSCILLNKYNQHYEAHLVWNVLWVSVCVIITPVPKYSVHCESQWLWASQKTAGTCRDTPDSTRQWHPYHLSKTENGLWQLGDEHFLCILSGDPSFTAGGAETHLFWAPPVKLNICGTSQKFGHTYSFQGLSLFWLFSTMYNNSEDIKTMK